MKTKRLVVSWLALVMASLIIVSCPNPIGSSSSMGGSLSIQLTNNINARTLLPPIDMNAASFTVSGVGPGGATFSQSTSGGSVTVSDLAFGSWSVTVNALNAGGTLIGSGQATVTVHTGQTSTVDISVVPLGGNGTLNLSVTWTGSQVETPSIQASLTPPSGPVTPLSFSVSGNQATYSSSTIPAGYQTLTLQLLDNNIPVMGAVDVARIVAGQTTTGSYAFTNVNQPGGSVVVNITPAMADPILVSISGVAATIAAGTSMTATASATDGTANVVWVWYINGASVGTGTSLTVGSNLAAGYYRLDVAGYTADGTRGGSASASFQVLGASGNAGPYVYVANEGSNSVSAYSIGSNGALTQLTGSPFAAGPFPYGVAVSPNGSFLYVTNYTTSGSVSAYSIGSNGALTQLTGSPFAAGIYADEVAVSPNGSFLYVTNEGSYNVSAYSIGSNGALTQLTGSPFAAGLLSFGGSVTVSPNGSFLYVTNEASYNVSAYSIGSNGALTQLTGSPFADGSGSFGV